MNLENFTKLEGSLGISFRNKDYLVQAFCHRSFINENPKFHLGHNERLEFLGDAVLELVTTQYLFKSYPEKPEGDMTGWRASLVNSNILSELARDLGFEDYLLLSQGELKEKGKSKKYILADCFEAFIGALYLDQGYEICRQFLEKYLIKPKLPEIIEKRLYKDPKSLFQEKSQEILFATPTYQVLEETGPDHMKKFKVGVFIGEEMITDGEGSSKHEAEINAAQRALELKDWK